MRHQNSSVDDKVEQFLRDEVRRLLDQCTEKQIAGFNRIWPKGIGSIPTASLRDTAALCERTIASNQTGNIIKEQNNDK